MAEEDTAWTSGLHMRTRIRTRHTQTPLIEATCSDVLHFLMSK